MLGIGNANPSFPTGRFGTASYKEAKMQSVLQAFILIKYDNSNTQAYVGMHSDNLCRLFWCAVKCMGNADDTTTVNLGIGNANPQYLLDISGSCVFGARMQLIQRAFILIK
jgi:hypothetical protein